MVTASDAKSRPTKRILSSASRYPRSLSSSSYDGCLFSHERLFNLSQTCPSQPLLLISFFQKYDILGSGKTREDLRGQGREEILVLPWEYYRFWLALTLSWFYKITISTINSKYLTKSYKINYNNN